MYAVNHVSQKAKDKISNYRENNNSAQEVKLQVNFPVRKTL